MHAAAPAEPEPTGAGGPCSTVSQLTTWREPIVVHTPASLAHELGAEARKERVIDERVAASVRELGRVPG